MVLKKSLEILFPFSFPLPFSSFLGRRPQSSLLPAPPPEVRPPSLSLSLGAPIGSPPASAPHPPPPRACRPPPAPNAQLPHAPMPARWLGFDFRIPPLSLSLSTSPTMPAKSGPFLARPDLLAPINVTPAPVHPTTLAPSPPSPPPSPPLRLPPAAAPSRAMSSLPRVRKPEGHLVCKSSVVNRHREQPFAAHQ